MFRYYTRNCIALKIEMPIFCAKRSRSATQLYLFNITLFFKTHYTLCGFCFVKEIFLLNPTLSKFSDQSPIFCWKLSSVRLCLMHSNALSAIHSSFWSYFKPLAESTLQKRSQHGQSTNSQPFGMYCDWS